MHAKENEATYLPFDNAHKNKGCNVHSKAHIYHPGAKHTRVIKFAVPHLENLHINKI